jgi:hypothetical protein
MQNKIKNILVVAGIVEILVGLLHYGMPDYLYQSSGFEQLNQIESDYVLLVTYAVGILLIAFGGTTILLSSKINKIKEIVFYYLIIKIILWTARVFLEMIYPLKLSMFYIEPFTLIVLPGLIIELLLFIISAILLKKLIKKDI